MLVLERQYFPGKISENGTFNTSKLLVESIIAAQ